MYFYDVNNIGIILCAIKFKKMLVLNDEIEHHKSKTIISLSELAIKNIIVHINKKKT